MGPWIEEDDFDIEDEEDHCDEVEADVEAFAGGVDGGHARFVGDAFAVTFAGWAEESGSDEVHRAESDRCEEHEEDREVGVDWVACEGG